MYQAQKGTVELIASGYEWECPECKTLNKEIEAKTQGECKECGADFDTDPPEHAYE